jgi:hypothetical protein
MFFFNDYEVKQMRICWLVSQRVNDINAIRLILQQTSATRQSRAMVFLYYSVVYTWSWRYFWFQPCLVLALCLATDTVRTDACTRYGENPIGFTVVVFSYFI